LFSASFYDTLTRSAAVAKKPIALQSALRRTI